MTANRTNTRRRRRRREPRRKTPKTVIFAGIFLLAILTNILFPAFSRAVGDRVNSVFNYRGAFAALGEGISGERRFTDALGDAWTVAFSGGRSTEEDAASDTPSESAPPEASVNAAPPNGGGSMSGDLRENIAIPVGYRF